MKIYDITRTLSATLAVWPGDQPFASRWSARIEDGSSVNVGAMKMSTHAGTHVDAPLHYLQNGDSVDRIPLETFVGAAYVVDAGQVQSIGIRHVEELDFTGVPRVLFKTRASDAADEVFQEDFTYIEPEIIAFLSAHGVSLVGTDAPSVDPFDSASLPTHRELARCGIANLENLFLKNVTAGLYHLIALPLNVSGLDAAPVRAILTPLGERDTPGASH